MLPDVLPVVRRIWETLPSPTCRLFPRISRTATLNSDLVRANISKRDQEDREADFHSLRYFSCTQMARRLPIQKVRLLMRHKDIRTTCNLYMDLGIQDVMEEVWALPSILKSKPRCTAVSTNGKGLTPLST